MWSWCGLFNYLLKKLHEKLPVNGRKAFVFNDQVEVVISKNMSIKISYNIQQERAYVTFYMQSYDRGDFAKNVVSQKLINKDWSPNGGNIGFVHICIWGV